MTVKINLLGVAETSDTSISSSRMIPVAYVTEVPYDKNFNLVATITPEVPAIKQMLRQLLIHQLLLSLRNHQLPVLLAQM